MLKGAEEHLGLLEAGRTGRGPPPQTLEGERPCQHRVFRATVYRTKREKISVVSGHLLSGILLGQP